MNEYDRYGDYTEQTQEASGENGSAIKFLLIGMGIGAAIVLLVSPVSGAELRRTITRGFRSTVNGISQGTQNLRERGSNLLGFSRRRQRAVGSEYEESTGI